jgi:hypothetical protein
MKKKEDLVKERKKYLKLQRHAALTVLAKKRASGEEGVQRKRRK